MQLPERILRFIPNEIGTHWDNICDEFSYRDTEEISESLLQLLHYEMIEKYVTADGRTYYKRTPSGLQTVKKADEAARRAKQYPEFTIYMTLDIKNVFETARRARKNYEAVKKRTEEAFNSLASYRVGQAFNARVEAKKAYEDAKAELAHVILQIYEDLNPEQEDLD